MLNTHMYNPEEFPYCAYTSSGSLVFEYARQDGSHIEVLDRGQLRYFFVDDFVLKLKKRENDSSTG